MDRNEAAALLGVPVGATRSEVFHAFARNARLTHPDLLPGATPEAVRAANDRFIRLAEARDILLTHSRSVRTEDVGADPPGGVYQKAATVADSGAAHSVASAQAAEHDEWVPTRRVGQPKGMAGSILSVVVIAIVLVVVVSLQDSWRSQFWTVGRDLTPQTTVAAVTDPVVREDECPATGACVLLGVTPGEDCADALARFEVIGEDGSGDDSTTETRELLDLHAGEPTAVALSGTSATLIYLSCDR